MSKFRGIARLPTCPNVVPFMVWPPSACCLSASTWPESSFLPWRPALQSTWFNPGVQTLRRVCLAGESELGGNASPAAYKCHHHELFHGSNLLPFGRTLSLKPPVIAENGYETCRERQIVTSLSDSQFTGLLLPVPVRVILAVT